MKGALSLGSLIRKSKDKDATNIFSSFSRYFAEPTA